MAKNDFDRISRENVQTVFVPYAERMLNAEILNSNAMPTKLTGTYEYEVDHLVKATTKSGDEMLLHFEFQTHSDPTMLKRIQRYHGVLFHKYGLPIHHFVFYYGQKKAVMKTELEDAEVFKGFYLITPAEQKLEDFLSAASPEEVLMGILSDFGSHKTSRGIQMIIDTLQKTSKDEVQLRRHLQQLKILARLRKLETVVQETINKMPIIFDIKDSYDYQEGLKEGIGKGRDETILQLISSGAFSREKIAEALGVSLEDMTKQLEEIKKEVPRE